MPSTSGSDSSRPASPKASLQMQDVCAASEKTDLVHRLSLSAEASQNPALALQASELSKLAQHESWNWKRRHALDVLVSPSFDICMGVIIVANVVIMIIETDQTANEDTSSGAAWTGAFGWIVLVTFVFELLLRLAVFQSKFWLDPWNLFDFTVVIFDVVFSLIGLVAEDAFPVSVLRVFRLAKLARVSKILRVLPELRLLLGGLLGSIRAIIWGFLLLVFFLIVWAIAAVLLIHPLAKKMDLDSCGQCPDAYDSVFHAALTFWQQIVAGDAWAEATVPIIRKYPATMFFFIPLFMTIGMAVMNLILGVVVDIALTEKNLIEKEDHVLFRLWKMEKRTHLLDLCHKMGDDATGRVNREDVLAKFKEPGEFQDTIRSMDMTGEDLDIIWAVIDKDRDGSVPYKELVNGLYSMRESDNTFTLASLKFHITIIKNDLLKSLARMEAHLASQLHKIDEEVEDIEANMVPPIITSPGTGLKQEAYCSEASRPAVAFWQVLDENNQKSDNAGGSNGFQLRRTAGLETSTSSTNISSSALADKPHGRLKIAPALQASMHSTAASKRNGWNGDWCTSVDYECERHPKHLRHHREFDWDLPHQETQQQLTSADQAKFAEPVQGCTQVHEDESSQMSARSRVIGARQRATSALRARNELIREPLGITISAV